MEISVNNVKYDDTKRIRTEIDSIKLAEIMESFKNIGQLTPIILDRNEVLLAGRTRLEAAKKLGWETIRFEYFESLDPITQKIVEFDENDKRSELTWQDKAKAVKEIHDLKVAEQKRLAPASSAWTITDTAKELGRSQQAVSEDLVLAVALANSRVASRPTRKGALDTVRRERELSLVRELARRRATNLGIRDISSEGLIGGVIHNADCRQTLAAMDEGSVDLIFTDPPWGIDFDKASQWSKKWIATYEDEQESVHTMLVEAFPLLYKVLRPSCHMYTFYPIQEVQWWVEQLTKVGFITRQRPLIWFKTGTPGISSVYTSFLPAYESILWCYKPGINDARRLFSHAVPEAQGFPREPTLWHENSKPVDMITRWLEASSEPNEIVLDPFCGGGSTLASAFDKGRYYIGLEKDPANYARVLERMKQLEARREEDTNPQ